MLKYFLHWSGCSKDRERNRTRRHKGYKETEKQSDARENGEAAMLQVQHDKPPFKQWGHTHYFHVDIHVFPLDLLLTLFVFTAPLLISTDNIPHFDLIIFSRQRCFHWEEQYSWHYLYQQNFAGSLFSSKCIYSPNSRNRFSQKDKKQCCLCGGNYDYTIQSISFNWNWSIHPWQKNSM